MPQTRFTKIRLLLKAANDLYDEEKISTDEFLEIINKVEEDFNTIVADMDQAESSSIILGYLDDLRA